MNPQVADVLAGVSEKRDATSRALTAHYERSSEWLTEAILTCKRKILEGTGHEVTIEPKRLKTTTNKENVAAQSNVKSVVKKPKKVIPASAKKVSAKNGAPQYHADDESLPIMSMKVAQLRTELRKRKLDTTGLKKDLQRRLMEHVQAIEIKKRPESKSVVVKSAVKAKALAAASSAKKKDRDGDVRMEEVGSTSDGGDSRRDSSKMDVDENIGASKETMVAKSFLKSTTDLFSPQKVVAKIQSSKKVDQMMVDLASSATKETNPTSSATKSGRQSLTEGLKKTASAILTASPVRKAPSTQTVKSPFTKGSAVKAKSVVKPKEEVRVLENKAAAQSSSESSKSSANKPSASSKNQPMNDASVATASKKLGSIDKNAGAATKAKRNKNTADRMARLAEIRGKSKPIASTKSGTAKDLPALSASKALKLGSAKAKDGKSDRKLLLTAQMREKAAASLKAQGPASAKVPSSSKLLSSSQRKNDEPSRAPMHTATTTTTTTTTTTSAVQSQPLTTKITASPKVAVPKKKVVPSSSASKVVKASSSKKKKASRPDVLSPMSTYEMSDREQSDSDESETESHHHRQKKKVPSWAQKKNLYGALEKQYAGGQLDPETIFPPVTTCNLEDIFDQKKSRYNRRTSSANWSKDGVTQNEIVSYKRTMGY